MDKNDQVDWSSVTADQALELLLAMRSGQGEEVLDRKLRNLPKKEKEKEEEDDAQA